MPETPSARLSMYAATLRRRWLLVTCIVAVSVAAGLVVASLSSTSYEATAKVLIGQRAQVDALLGAADYTPDPERDVNTSLELVTLEPVAESVRRRLDLELPVAPLIGKVATAIDRNSNLVSITVRDASPGRAAAIANAFATAYRDFRARSARASLDNAVAAAERRAAGLSPGPERAALEAELRQLQAVAAFQTGGVQIVRRASADSAVASRHLLPSVVVSGFLGLVLAAVAVVVLARTDRRVRTESDLEAIVGRPVLATVPTSRGRRAAAQADAMATLALSLTLGGVPPREQGPPQRNGGSASVLLVTSSGPAEGTTEVALGLAHSFGEMGLRAIAIEADLRAPAFAARLDAEPAAGLAAILNGTSTFEEELVELGWGGGSGEPVWALPGGWPLPVPQPLLAGRSMAALVADARRRADVVILAGAPAAEFGDSFALVPLADTVLLVARLDVTDREEAARVTRALEALTGTAVEAVATTGRKRLESAPAGTDAGRPGATLEPWEPPSATSNGSAATGSEAIAR